MVSVVTTVSFLTGSDLTVVSFLVVSVTTVVDPLVVVSEPEVDFEPEQAAKDRYEEEKIIIKPHAPRGSRATGTRVLAAVSLVLVAGIVSLGAGVLMSYYLHSVTTVQDASQTSSVILSN